MCVLLFKPCNTNPKLHSDKY